MGAESELLPDEHPLLTVNPHPVVLVARGFVVVAVGLVLIIVGLVVPLGAGLRDMRWFAVLMVALVLFVFLDIQYIRWRSESFSITDQRIILRRGVIGRFSRSIALGRVQDVSTNQGALGRLLNFGTVEVESAGRDGAEVLTYVPDPVHFRNVLFESMHHPAAAAT